MKREDLYTGMKFKYLEIPIKIEDNKPTLDTNNQYWKDMIIISSINTSTSATIDNTIKLYNKNPERFKF